MRVPFVAAIVAGACVLVPTTASANGCITHSPTADGTAAHPFLIANVGNLQCMRDNPVDYWTGQHFRQTTDLDLTGQPVWTSTIGDAGTPFTGSYDGNGKRITGLQVALGNNSSAGLFGVTSGATLSDVTLADANVSIAQDGSDTDAGILVGTAQNGTVISRVHSSGTVTGQGAGGVVGDAMTGSTISSSSSSATIVGNDWCAGGLVGCADMAEIADSSASGQVTGDVFVGGLVGGAWERVAITRSFATGGVTGRPPHVGYPGDSGDVGGLVGFMQSGLNATDRVTISSSFATGAVTASDPVPPPNPSACGSCAGGLVGSSVADPGSPDNAISMSYASGDVTSGTTAGGLLGMNIRGNLTIAQSYSRGAVRGPGGATGGVFGAVRSGAPDVTATFWNPTDAGIDGPDSYGTRATQAAMQTPALYAAAGWDIADAAPTTRTWVSCAAHNGGYPFLQWWGAAQNWSCEASAAGNTTPGTPTTPDDPAPSTPTRITWRLAGTTATSTFAAAPDTTYAITAARVATMAREAARTAATRRGTCTTSPDTTAAKRTARCTIHLTRGATWIVKITPSRNGATGTPATKRFRIRARAVPMPVTG